MKPKLEGAEAKAQVSNGITAGMLQRWRLGEHGHIQTMTGPEGSQCCIDIDGKNPAEGARVHLWNAHMPNPAFPPATQQVRRPICNAHARLTGSLCLQMWVHSGEGCLESKMHGKVLQIQGAVAEGSEVETSNRTGEPKQVWRFCKEDAW